MKNKIECAFIHVTENADGGNRYSYYLTPESTEYLLPPDIRTGTIEIMLKGGECVQFRLLPTE